MVGFGSAIYLTTNLGPGTRDGLMKGISENYKKPITFVRLFIELIVVILGWLLGGTVGLGTMLFALLIGPCISINLLTIKKLIKLDIFFLFNTKIFSLSFNYGIKRKSRSYNCIWYFCRRLEILIDIKFY